MSTRYLKKVHGNNSTLEENLEENDAESNYIQVGCEKKKHFNVFDLLNQQENSENEDDASSEDNKEEIEDEVSDEKIKSKINKKKRKKHKKNQKLKNVERNAADSSKDSENGLDEIDKTVRQLNKLFGEPKPSTSQAENSQMYVIAKSKEQSLIIQHKNLNPYNELKRIFGSRTIQAEQSQLKLRNRSRHIKKMWLVTVKENMLPVQKTGISMTVDKSKTGDNCQYFVYEHSPSYQQIQKKFIDAVESLNPENIISILNTYPYHVDALLQSAELCKMSEELALAAKLIERALFFLEYAFHPLFNLTTGKCRLDYKKQQNRALFIALFKHLVLVGGRACYRTSLELCKLLLSLEPEDDPLAVVLMIDFYAIRSKEYEWFKEFCNLWENSRNLLQLPNIAYSLSLAYFYLGEQEKADELLQNALILFPGVLIPLLDKCGINPDYKVTSHNFFQRNASSSTPPALEKLQTLYIARSFHLWKEAEILPWLEKQVHLVFDRVDSNDDYVKLCQVKRKSLYARKLPRNILRHIIVSDLKDVTVDLQGVQSDGPLLSHDPLPPVDSVDIYINPRNARRNNQNNANLISLFFASLFPDFDENVGANGVNDQNEPLHDAYD